MKNYHISARFFQNGEDQYVADRFAHTYEKAKEIMNEEIQTIKDDYVEVEEWSDENEWDVVSTETSFRANGQWDDSLVEASIEEFEFED